MGRRGTKAAPTAIKLLKGTQPCRINFDEPQIDPHAPDKPDYIAANPHASEYWDEIAPQLVSLRILSNTDRLGLSMLCLAYAAWRRDPTDLKQETALRRWLGEFGLTPSSRSALKVTASSGPRDELGDFLARNA